MSRSTGGIYSLPLPQVQSGNVVSSYWANTTLADIKTEMTNSLSRDGYGNMRAPLRVPDGSKAIPSLAFNTDTDSGLYLAADSDVRMSVATTDIMKWAPSLVTAYQPVLCSSTLTVTGATSLAGGVNTGLAVTNTTTNGNGITATGNGTGSGVVATGGASGVGVSASGGIVGTTATIGTSTLTYSPVYRYVNSAITTTSGNQHPLQSLQWSAGGQTAGLTTKTKNTGAVTDWMNVDVGLSYAVGSEGSAVDGAGGQLWFSVSGLKAYRWLTDPATTSAARNALSLMNGYLSLDGVANPTNTVAVKNAITPTNIPKAWARVSTNGSGSVTVSSGFNLTAAISGSFVRFTFPSGAGMANTTYAVTITGTDEGTEYYATSLTTTTFDVGAYTYALNGPGTAVVTNSVVLNSSIKTFSVVVYGAQ